MDYFIFSFYLTSNNSAHRRHIDRIKAIKKILCLCLCIYIKNFQFSSWCVFSNNSSCNEISFYTPRELSDCKTHRSTFVAMYRNKDSPRDASPTSESDSETATNNKDVQRNLASVRYSLLPTTRFNTIQSVSFEK